MAIGDGPVERELFILKTQLARVQVTLSHLCFVLKMSDGCATARGTHRDAPVVAKEKDVPVEPAAQRSLFDEIQHGTDIDAAEASAPEAR